MNSIAREDWISNPRKVPKFDPILRFTPNNTVKNVNKNTIKLLSLIFSGKSTILEWTRDADYSEERLSAKPFDE